MSATTDTVALTADDLNPTETAILDELREGRCTPAFIAEVHDYSPGNVRNRITNLAQHGHVEALGGGLYQLVDDPRADADTPADDQKSEADRLRKRGDVLERELENAEAALEADRPEDRPREEELARAHRGVEAALTALEGKPGVETARSELTHVLEILAEVDGGD